MTACRPAVLPPRPSASRGRARCAAVAGLAAVALAGAVHAQRLPFRTYSSDDGLAQSVVMALLEDRDGYLWAGTAAGLSRFDGLVFTNFTEDDGLADDTVRALLEDRDGNLWVGTDAGLTRRGDDGHWRTVPLGDGPLAVRALAETADGTVWAGTYGDGVLAVRPDGTVERFGVDEGLPSAVVRALVVGPRGALWVGTYGGGIAVVGDGPVRVLDAAQGLADRYVRALLVDRRGRVLAGTNHGVFVAEDERFAPFLADEPALAEAVTALLEDRRGRLWIGTREEGVCRLDGGALECYRVEQGLTDESVNALLEDREGSLWLGTFGGGMSRLSSEGFVNFGTADGLPVPSVMGFSRTAGGDLWLATHGGGAVRYRDGALTVVDSRDGLVHDKLLTAEESAGAAPWFGSLAGAVEVRDDGFRTLDADDGLPSATVLAITHDDARRLWVGTIAGLAVFTSADDPEPTVYRVRDGLPHDRVNVLHPARADGPWAGGMWAGTGNGLAYFRDGTWRSWRRTDGLVDGYVTDVLENADGVWVSTGRGLSRLADGEITSWTTADGLAHDNCTALVDDEAGRLWVGTSAGIHLFDGASFSVFDRRDGLISGEVNLNAAIRDANGDLWFGTVRGAVLFRSAVPSPELPPPPVHVTRVEAGHRALDLGAPVTVDARDADLYFEYVAVSLGYSEDVEYEVRLAGLDDRWRRTAARAVEYPAVPPGSYVFEVRAKVREGPWSTTTARVELDIPPPFWRTAWFQVGTTLLVLGGVLFLYRRRIRRMEERQGELERTVAERERAEAEVRRYARELEHANLHDHLTALPNRALFRDRVEVALAQVRRHRHRAFAVLVLDIDRFQLVIDSHGHDLGDEILVECGRRLSEALLPEDTVSRLGSDVFALLVADIDDATDATRVAERLQAIVAEPFAVRGQRMVLSAGIGIAIGSAEERDADALLRNADIAMHRAKKEGRGRSALFDPHMHAVAVHTLRLEGDLRRAIERAEFRLRYQPIRCLESGRIDGFEALLRWRHPERGLLTPGAFLAQAEETGLGLDLDDWVLREASTRAARWLGDGPPVGIAVNLSHRQLSEPGLAQRIATHLEASGLPSRRLRIEITEDVLIGDPEAAVRALADVKALDVEVHLDDFGTGFSSLSYLQRFPVDVLKIDRSFIRRLTDADGSAKIVESILHLARNLGIGVIAEGVETAEQLARLEEMGCDHAQGFYISEPLTGAEAAALLLAPPPGELDAARDGDMDLAS